MLKISKKTLPFIPLYYGDFLASVDSLSNDEAFGYMRLISHFWAHGPLVNNKVMLDRIARTDSDLIVAMFFHTDGDGRLYPPDFADLKAQAIEIGKKNAERTAKATAEAAKRRRNGSVTENFSVTETDTEGDGDGESDSKPESNSEPHSDHPSSVAERFIQKFGNGSPMNGTERPPSGRGTPQMSVTESGRVITMINSAGEHRVYNLRPETIANWKARFPNVDIDGLLESQRELKTDGPLLTRSEFTAYIHGKAEELERAA